MVRLNKIYTRTGDTGSTSLVSGQRVPKYDLRIAAYGTVDETNACIGLARHHAAAEGQTGLDAMLARIQNDLFDLGADLATPRENTETPGEALRITQGQVDRLESEIDALNGALAPLKSFVPPGVSLEMAGAKEGSGQANGAMLRTLPIGMLLLVFILLAEFNSFRRLFIVLVTIPLAATGVVPGLVFAGQPFGFMSLLGVFALIGIVVNNAIVLIDVIDSLRREGMPVEAAVREGVRRRTRPILLTTTTTVAGLLPLALSSTSLWPPLAWAMISGLISSTVLTLLVAPALYLVLLGKERASKPENPLPVSTEAEVAV